MTVYQEWKRNDPDTSRGESITVSLTYCSFDKDEIDRIEKEMPKNSVVMCTDEGAGRRIDL